MKTTQSKIIFKNGQAPGDIVVMSAMIRDLHRTYPGQYVTDVRTVGCDEIFLNNPHISRLCEDNPEVKTICIENRYVHKTATFKGHYIQGLISEANDKLGLNIRLSELKPDIHLTQTEKEIKAVWPGECRCIDEILNYLDGEPYWIIAPGWKQDVTIKAWDPLKWQSVIDHFAGRIKFVQVGSNALTPSLTGVLNLSGRTEIRHLCRLIYRSSGVLCHVSLPMHLAAAFEKPCIVVAGGRETLSWAAYPQHSFLNTIGQLPCCASGGCWKLRTIPLAEARDKNGFICCYPVLQKGTIPQPMCMKMITPEHVIEKIYLHLKRQENPNESFKNAVLCGSI